MKTRKRLKKMSLVECLGDFFNKQDYLNKAYCLGKNPFRILIDARELYKDIKTVHNYLIKIFNSDNYLNTINEISIDEFLKIKNNLIILHGQISKTINKLSSIKPFFLARPFIWASIHELKKENEYIEEKIFDYQFGINNKFPEAMEKIISGIENSNLNKNGIRHFGPII